MRFVLTTLAALAVAGTALADGADDVNAGIAAYERGDYKLALDYYSRGIESGDLTAEQLAIAYVNRCSTYHTLGEHEKAELDCDVAIELNAEDPIAYNLRGTVRAAREDDSGALADFDTAIGLNPDYAEAYNNRALVLREGGETEKALESFGTAIWLKPDYVEAYLNRGETYRRARLLDRAIADFDTAIGLQPNYANAYVGRGAAYQAQGKKEQAIADYKKAQSLDPDHPFLKRKMREIGML